MSAYTATIEWTRDGQDFLAGRYSRAHTLRFDGATVAGSSSPSVVPLPWSVEAAVDPEEMFVASLSSCHMLWFLDLARQDGLQVDSYVDEATGRLERDPARRLAMTQVVLRPKVRFASPQPAEARVLALHHKAHDACFIANSVRTEVLVEPVLAARHVFEEERQNG